MILNEFYEIQVLNIININYTSNEINKNKNIKL